MFLYVVGGVTSIMSAQPTSDNAPLQCYMHFTIQIWDQYDLISGLKFFSTVSLSIFSVRVLPQILQIRNPCIIIIKSPELVQNVENFSAVVSLMLTFVMLLAASTSFSYFLHLLYFLPFLLFLLVHNSQ